MTIRLLEDGDYRLNEDGCIRDLEQSGRMTQACNLRTLENGGTRTLEGDLAFLERSARVTQEYNLRTLENGGARTLEDDLAFQMPCPSTQVQGPCSPSVALNRRGVPWIGLEIFQSANTTIFSPEAYIWCLGDNGAGCSIWFLLSGTDPQNNNFKYCIPSLITARCTPDQSGSPTFLGGMICFAGLGSPCDYWGPLGAGIYNYSLKVCSTDCSGACNLLGSIVGSFTLKSF